MIQKESVNLITGAGGFIGSHLVETLKSRGEKTVCLDRKYLYSPKNLKKIISANKPNRVYHLAAYGNHSNQKEVGRIFKANLLGTFNLLNALKDINIESFINTGSSSEYGKKNTAMEESMILEPDTFYGATKAGATYLARAFAKQYKIPAVTIRPFSVYGPGEASHRFIPTLIKCCQTGNPITLASGVHDWIYIDDFIAGVLLVAKNAKKLSGEVINIGTGKQYSNMQIVKIVSENFNRPIKIERTKMLRTYDTTKMWKADNKKIKSLGWKPKTDIVEGIKKTIHAQKSSN